MSTTNWIGNAPAVAQVANATFTTYDVATTRTITIGTGGLAAAISAADSGSTLTAALAALATLLNAGLVGGAAHPYFTTITWTSNATQIIATAKTAGVPFTFLASVSGGTGTVSNTYAVATASSGPNDVSTAANWDNGVPVNSSIINLSNSSSNLCWNLQALAALTGTTINSYQTFTGRVGLDYTNFATNSDGTIVSTPARAEYRQTNFQLGSSASSTVAWTHGDSLGIGSPAGSSRFCFDTGNSVLTATIINSASSSADTGRPAIRWIGVNASNVLNIRSASGGFGVCAEKPGDVATLATLNCTDTTGQTKIVTGYGMTCTTVNLSGGTHIIKNSSATITTFSVSGGNVRTEGTSAITTMNVNGGAVTANQTGTITTLNCNAGSTSFLGSSNARTVTTLNMKPGSGATCSYDQSVLTVTNALTGKMTITGN